MTNQNTKPNANATILIVDDNPDNRLLLSSQLGMHGYKILEAEDGHKGIDVAQRQKPDLILLDVMMPMINGFEVCERLKKNPETNSIPVIIITALRDIEYRIRGIEVGADEFLSRPHHREELLVRVRSLIRLKQARDRMQLLYNVTRATTNTQLDIDQIMSQIITHTQAAVGATKGSIMLLNEEQEVTHKILIRAGLTPEMTEHVTREVLSRGLAGWLIRHKRGDIIQDAQTDDRWIILPDDTEQVGSVIGVPFVHVNTVTGVLLLVHPDKGYFRGDHLELLQTIAAQVTVAIHNAYLFNETREQERKLGAILSQSSDAIITTDESLQLQILNQAAEKMFKLRESAVLNRHIQYVSPLNPLVPLFKLASNQPITEEIVVNGGTVLFTSVSPIPDVGYMAVMQDITKLKQMEEMRIEQERREKKQVKDTFSRYMSPRLVEQVLTNSAEPTLFGRRERRQAVVMFADLRGFTRMIVDLTPDASIKVLNGFFTEMTDVVYEFDGTIFDLAGDELMIGFNVPFSQEDAAYRAVSTGISMQKRFDELRQVWFRETGTDLGLGVGIDTGEVVMGNVGAETRMNFQMVGEAVNTAHRLVDIAKDGQIVISAAVYADLSERGADFGSVGFYSVGEQQLKGKSAPEKIYVGELPRTELS